MWVGQGWNRKLVVGNEFGMNAELARPGSGPSHLDYGQAFSLDSKCSEKPSRDFKGENGMIDPRVSGMRAKESSKMERVQSWSAASRKGKGERRSQAVWSGIKPSLVTLEK